MILLRQWWKTAAMSAASYTGDSPLFLLDYALRAFRVAVLLALWRVVYQGREDLPMSLDEVLTYALVAEVFAAQLNLQTGLWDAFWQGTLVRHFLRPMGLVSQFAAETLGRWWIDLALFSLPLLLIAPLLGVSPLPAGPLALLTFVLSLSLAISVGLAIDFGFGVLALWLELPGWLMHTVRGALTGLLAGAVIPLALLPWGLGVIFEWLPFASVAWAPLAIYTGAGDPVRLLGLQLFWLLVLWPVVFWAWNACREKVVGHGG